MLQATDVWFGYDDQKPVLRGVSLAVPAGGIVGILGPNGSGKTTLLRMLAGTRQPQRGSVTLDGAPLTRFSRAALARRMAVVPQETQLAFDYTVAEVAMMGRYPHLGPFEIEGPADLAVIEETLTSTGTLHLKDRLFATLSGGEKQRVVIAAALAQIFRLPPSREALRRTAQASADGGKAEATRIQEGATAPGVQEGATAPGVQEGARATGVQGGAVAAGSPQTDAGRPQTESRSFRLQAEESTSGYLLLDEPTASLDLGYQLEVAALLTQLHEERRVAIVISTHDLGLAGTLCDSLMMIRDGLVIANGPTDEVLTTGNVREVYGVEADVIRHPSGHRVVVPVRRTPGAPRG